MRKGLAEAQHCALGWLRHLQVSLQLCKTGAEEFLLLGKRWRNLCKTSVLLFWGAVPRAPIGLLRQEHLLLLFEEPVSRMNLRF